MGTRKGLNYHDAPDSSQSDSSSPSFACAAEFSASVVASDDDGGQMVDASDRAHENKQAPTANVITIRIA